MGSGAEAEAGRSHAAGVTADPVEVSKALEETVGRVKERAEVDLKVRGWGWWTWLTGGTPGACGLGRGGGKGVAVGGVAW